jgi:biotin-[acetyl-CoA-carboxylase] ligase BirA-like protein
MQLKVFPILRSTNSWCIDNIHTLPPTLCVVADQQTGGRGRNGDWISPLGNLYLSIVLPITLDAKYLPLIVSYAIVHYYEQHSINLRVKWPNDIMLGKKKVGGILVEVVPRKEQYSAIIGIGLNLTKSIDAMNPHYNAGCINDDRDPHQIAQEIASTIERMVLEYKNSKSFISDYYKSKLVFQTNNTILLTLENGKKQNVVYLDVLSNGDILFLYQNRTQQLPLEVITIIEYSCSK